MANNDTDVPRCRVCGRYMQKTKSGERVIVYECCGDRAAIPAPEQTQWPETRRWSGK